MLAYIRGKYKDFRKKLIPPSSSNLITSMDTVDPIEVDLGVPELLLLMEWINNELLLDLPFKDAFPP